MWLLTSGVRRTQFCILPLLRRSDQFHTFKSMIWLKIVQCVPEVAKIFTQYDAEKHKSNSISVLAELLCTLDSRLFSADASRILIHALHDTRLGKTNFPTRWTFTFFRDCVTFVIFFTLDWSQDFVLFRGLYEDFGGSSS